MSPVTEESGQIGTFLFVIRSHFLFWSLSRLPYAHPHHISYWAKLTNNWRMDLKLWTQRQKSGTKELISVDTVLMKYAFRCSQSFTGFDSKPS